MLQSTMRKEEREHGRRRERDWKGERKSKEGESQSEGEQRVIRTAR